MSGQTAFGRTDLGAKVVQALNLQGSESHHLLGHKITEGTYTKSKWGPRKITTAEAWGTSSQNSRSGQVLIVKPGDGFNSAASFWGGLKSGSILSLLTELGFKVVAIDGPEDGWRPDAPPSFAREYGLVETAQSDGEILNLLDSAEILRGAKRKRGYAALGVTSGTVETLGLAGDHNTHAPVPSRVYLMEAVPIPHSIAGAYQQRQATLAHAYYKTLLSAGKDVLDFTGPLRRDLIQQEVSPKGRNFGADSELDDGADNPEWTVVKSSRGPEPKEAMSNRERFFEDLVKGPRLEEHRLYEHYFASTIDKVTHEPTLKNTSYGTLARAISLLGSGLVSTKKQLQLAGWALGKSTNDEGYELDWHQVKQPVHIVMAGGGYGSAGLIAPLISNLAGNRNVTTEVISAGPGEREIGHLDVLFGSNAYSWYWPVLMKYAPDGRAMLLK